jgi:hypothetical protein
MKFGLKKIFKRKTDQGITPTKASPQTPSTQPVKEDSPSAYDIRDDGPQGYSDDLPVKNLFKELSVYSSGLSAVGATELVLGDTSMDAPNDEPPMEPPRDAIHVSRSSDDSLPEEDEQEVGVAKKEEKTPVKAKTVTDEMSVDSPLRPRQLDPSGVLAGDDESIADPPAERTEKDNEGNFTRTIMNLLERAQECGGRLPEPIQKLIPTADNDMCQTIGGGRVRSYLPAKRPKLVRQYSYYNEKFALKILDVSVECVSTVQNFV